MQPTSIKLSHLQLTHFIQHNSQANFTFMIKKPSDRLKVSVTELSLLVSPGQSKKLAAIRNMFQAETKTEALQLQEKPVLTRLKPEVASELSQAQKLIDARINEIMRSFPDGRKNKLFGIRYGSVTDVKAASIKSAFKLLAIDANQVKIKLLADFNYHGDAAQEN